MVFSNGEILAIKNIEKIKDDIWYTAKEEKETDLTLKVGEIVKIIYVKRRLYDGLNIYNFTRDNLVSQNFDEKEMQLIFL